MQINPYILEKSVLFSGIAANNFEAVLGCVGARHKEFAKGEYISLQSEQLRSIGLIMSGRVLLLKEDIHGNHNILATLEPGEIFGETFVCGGAYTLSVSIQATEKTEVLFLSFDQVMHTCPNACEFHSKLITNMVIMIARKNLSLLEKLEVTTRHSLREKILTYLFQLTQRQGNAVVVSPLGRIELADFLGVNRSALTRELSRMQTEGLIKYDKKSFELIRPEGGW